MPTYQYACTDPACANRFELVQSFTDPSASHCPVCAAPVRKVYGSVGVVFKGSGFYRNDSRAGANGSSSNGTSSSGSGEGEPSPTSKSDGKPSTESSGNATKTESKTASADTSATKTPAKASA